MLSMKMSMDDHPEGQERSEKEQALPLNVSDCMDNPSCKDQPQPATCSGQPTGETIGSIQSRSLSAGNARKLIQKQDDILYYHLLCREMPFINKKFYQMSKLPYPIVEYSRILWT